MTMCLTLLLNKSIFTRIVWMTLLRGEAECVCVCVCVLAGVKKMV